MGIPAEKGGFPDRKSAIQFGEEQEALERRQKNTRPSELNITLKDFIVNVWKDTLDVEEQTKLDYERSINTHILPVFGDRVMSSVTPAEIKKWSIQMKSGSLDGRKPLAERTANKHVDQLASIFKVALQNDYIHKTPFVDFKRKKPKKINRVHPLSFNAVSDIAGSFAPKWQLLIWLGFYTGMRPSELLGLTYDRLDFELETIVIDRQLSRSPKKIFEDHLKTSKSYRTIRFPRVLQALVTEHVEAFGLGPEGLLFTNRNGNLWRYKDAAAMYRSNVAPFGIPKGEGLHQLRHAFVSTLIQLGGNAKQIQDWVGHEKITETIDVYGHLFPNSLNELSEKLDTFAQHQSTLRPERKMLA